MATGDRGVARRAKTGLPRHSFATAGGFGGVPLGFATDAPRGSAGSFTEQGVAMLSSVLNTRRAIEVNILIMRAFVRLRGMISSHKELLQKLEEMEMKYDEQSRVVFEAIRQLMTPPDPPIPFSPLPWWERLGEGGKGSVYAA